MLIVNSSWLVQSATNRKLYYLMNWTHVLGGSSLVEPCFRNMSPRTLLLLLWRHAAIAQVLNSPRIPWTVSIALQVHACIVSHVIHRIILVVSWELLTHCIVTSVVTGLSDRQMARLGSSLWCTVTLWWHSVCTRCQCVGHCRSWSINWRGTHKQ